VQITQDATEARWARFSNFRSVDLLNLRPHHRARTLTANPAPFYTAWVIRVGSGTSACGAKATSTYEYTPSLKTS